MNNKESIIFQGCSEEDKEYLIDRLVEYNLSQVPSNQREDFIDISRKIVDANGNIVAGIIARMYCWKCVYVDTLWIDEKLRGKGIGTMLLEEVEKISKEEGANLIHLDTFDFQAKDFYLSHGYKIFGELEDCPKGHSRYFMSKILK